MAQALDDVVVAASKSNLLLPDTFVRFIRDETLHERVRSSLCSYLSLGGPVYCPDIEAFVVEFLADQQGCAYWYLLLKPDCADHAIVGTTDFSIIGMEPGEPAVTTSEIWFCDESFESFICRYWLQEEVWFSENEGDPSPDVPEMILEAYK